MPVRGQFNAGLHRSRGGGCFYSCHLWDFPEAGLFWRQAGWIAPTSDGKVMEALEASYFARTNAWHMKEYYLVSSKRNYQLIQSK